MGPNLSCFAYLRMKYLNARGNPHGVMATLFSMHRLPIFRELVLQLEGTTCIGELFDRLIARDLGTISQQTKALYVDVWRAAPKLLGAEELRTEHVGECRKLV